MKGQLTGRKVLLITVSAFGVIIAANLAMVWAALGSWPGLEVKNSYVASQSFDRDAAAQKALGWTSHAIYARGHLSLQLTDAEGRPVYPSEIRVIVGRPTHERDDIILDLAAEPKGFGAAVELSEGQWQARVSATASDGTAYRVVLPVRRQG